MFGEHSDKRQQTTTAKNSLALIESIRWAPRAKTAQHGGPAGRPAANQVAGRPPT